MLNFSAGELSPKIAGRTDTTAYYAGASIIENALTSHYGSLFRTSGTHFVARTKYQDKKSRLIPFMFTVSDSYVLEFGHQYIRFYTHRGSVTTSGVNITDIGAVITVSGVAPENGTYIDIYGTGVKELDGKRFIVYDRTSNTFKIKNEDGDVVDTTDLTSNKGSVYPIYEITTPYGEDDLADIKFTREADITYITHPKYEPRKLSRFGATNWTLTTFNYTKLDIPPFLDINITDITLTPSAKTGAITLTASASFFKEGHIGAYFRIGDTTWGYAKVTAYTSETVVNATVIKDLPVNTATKDWFEGAFSEVQGYPVDCKLFEQRLYLAGTRSKPLTVWGSVIEQYENFEYGTKDDDAVSFRIGSNAVDRIGWIYPTDILNIGTASGIFKMSSVGDTTITQSNVSVSQQNEDGALNVTPIRCGAFVYYSSRNGTRLNRNAYSLETDTYSTEDLTYLSDHILKSGIKEIHLQQFPYNIIWIVKNNGEIATMTRVDEQNVKGWTRQTGKYESLAIIPCGEEDCVWCVAEREIDGKDMKYVEYFAPIDFGEQEDCFFVRSGLQYEGSPIQKLWNLDHLEGEEIVVLADGAVHPTVTVENGEIELNYPASNISLGLPYTTKVVTMSLDSETEEGTTQNTPKTVSWVGVKMYQSLGFRYGDINDEAFFGPPTMNKATPLFTGIKEVLYPSGWNKDKRVQITQEQPLPLHILGLLITM